MKQTRTTMVLAAKWLVVIAISLLVLPGNVLASKTVAAKKMCTACTQRCSCCISKAPANNAPAPVAPVSPSRSPVEKNFQFAPVIALLLTSVGESTAISALPSDFHSSSHAVPLHQRHCVYLI